MAKISYDGQSFSLDGRRIWLVSGAMHYPRIPRELWRDRLRAAKQAGINCIETYAFWILHEPEPGKFDFAGNLDVKHFVELIAEEGMFCIFRPGPYVCAEWDNGGLPSWLHTIKPDRRTGPLKIREGNGPFLSACSRYITEVMAQVRNLQISSPIIGGRPRITPTRNRAGAVAGGFVGQGGGPILMIQVENEWMSSNDEQDAAYHQQLIRLLRESGADVPLCVCNQLWQEVDGTIHTWNASSNLPADLRQLRQVQPNAPRLVTEYWTGWFDQWGRKHSDTVDADLHLERMASILGAGAQFNLFMFHGGTNLGFTGGRAIGGTSAFMTTSYDYDSPLSEAGGRGPKYDATKRVCLFASQFAPVLAGLDPSRQPAAIAPDVDGRCLSVIHLSGTRGDVVFLSKGAKDKTKQTTLLLPNGLTLPVPIGDQRATWLLLDTRLGHGIRLDYTNLSPLAYLDEKLLVLAGPAGAEGVVSLDGAQIDFKVPAGKTPLVEHVDGTTLLILNEQMTDASYATPEGWVVGAAGLDADDQPVPRKGWPQQFLISPAGEIEKRKVSPMRRPTSPKLGPWTSRGTEEWLDGSAESYRPIKGPTSFDHLEHSFGYGWYRLELPKSTAKSSSKIIFPGAADRLHIYRNQKLEKLIGVAPGANEFEPAAINVSGGATMMVDNLGRFNYGPKVGELKGIWQHAYAVKPLKLQKPVRNAQSSPDPFELAGYILHHRQGFSQPAEGLTWTIKPAGKKPLILEIRDLPVDAVLKINGEAVIYWSAGNSIGLERLLMDVADGGPFTADQNSLELALFAPLPPDVDPSKHLKLYQATANVTEKAKWSFSPWQVPDPTAEAFSNLSSKAKSTGQPTWFATTFSVASTRCPLFLRPKGMTKGQIYLNGHNVGRYFVATADGTAVPPQDLYYLPEPWIRESGDNQLLLFDEHGAPPHQIDLIYNEMGPYGS